jgi:hypothetical protein
MTLLEFKIISVIDVNKVTTKFIYYMHYKIAYKNILRKYTFNKLVSFLLRTENITFKGEKPMLSKIINESLIRARHRCPGNPSGSTLDILDAMWQTTPQIVSRSFNAHASTCIGRIAPRPGPAEPSHAVSDPVT